MYVQITLIWILLAYYGKDLKAYSNPYMYTNHLIGNLMVTM